MRSFGTSPAAPTAAILDFPLQAAMREHLRARNEARQTTLEAAPYVYESGWYHAEAIADDRRARDEASRADH